MDCLMRTNRPIFTVSMRRWYDHSRSFHRRIPSRSADCSTVRRRSILRFGSARVVTTALRKADLHHVTLHGLRHTVASTAILDGCPVTQVAHLLGHKSAIVTLAVYIHWFSQLESDDAVERVAQRLSGGTVGKKTVESDHHR